MAIPNPPPAFATEAFSVSSPTKRRRKVRSRRKKRATKATLTLKVPRLENGREHMRSDGFPKIDFGTGARSQEDEGDDEPRSQEDCDGIMELFGGLGVSSSNAIVWVKEGRVGQPKTTVRGES